jgi:hypothetical protein
MDIHNLDISMYSFKEVLELFNINNDEPTVQDVKNAKKTVLMTHPDKSKLDSKYFLFFKKAFDVLYNYYENNLKQNVDIDNADTDYKEYFDSDDNKGIQNYIGKIEKDKFNKKFNRLFEENANIKKSDPEKNNWFKDENPVFENQEETVNANSMNSVFNKFKQRNNAVVVHKDVQDMLSNSGSNIYDQENNDTYVTSDPFSKLKFDDLRKVHKDETVFAVGENDFNKVKQYGSMDEYKYARNSQSLNPIEKTEAEKMINNREKIRSDYIKEQQHKAYMQTLENEKNNQKFMSNFLHIGYK